MNIFSRLKSVFSKTNDQHVDLNLHEHAVITDYAPVFKKGNNWTLKFEYELSPVHVELPELYIDKDRVAKYGKMTVGFNEDLRTHSFDVFYTHMSSDDSHMNATLCLTSFIGNVSETWKFIIKPIKIYSSPLTKFDPMLTTTFVEFHVISAERLDV